MRGRAKARESALSLAIAGAWYTERFAREKKLKRLSIYLDEIKPRQPQTGADVLALMRGFQSAGIPIKIKKVSDGRNKPRR